MPRVGGAYDDRQFSVPVSSTERRCPSARRTRLLPRTDCLPPVSGSFRDVMRTTVQNMFGRHVSSARRICLVKPSALGDVVQTLPLLPLLKERFPEARISWVIRSELSGLLQEHPHLDEIIRFPRRGTWKAWWRLLRFLRERAFDIVFDLQGLLRTGIMTFATRATLRVGLQTAREGAGWACHVVLPDTGPLVPAHQRYWRVAEALGLGDRRRESIIALSQTDEEFARQNMQDLGRACLAIHPGARWTTKRWPVEHFAVIAARAARRYGLGLLILGNSAEQPVAKKLEHLLKRFMPAAKITNIAGTTNLKQLAAVLKRADVLLTNDSGPMHLAAAVKTPVLGVFTCTNPYLSGPPEKAHELVTTTLPCRNCYKKRCPLRGKRRLACLQEITTDRVWQAFERLVQRHGRRSAA